MIQEQVLSAGERHKIALDIAQVLTYLHNECRPRVLHRNIKPSNILLDNDLNAFLSGFGLARLLSASETDATTDVAGTFGYVAPEYGMTCCLSEKADVYSYGVVLLEMLSGKKALDPYFSKYGIGFNIVTWAGLFYQKGKPAEILAPGLWEQEPHSQLMDVLKLCGKMHGGFSFNKANNEGGSGSAESSAVVRRHGAVLGICCGLHCFRGIADAYHFNLPKYFFNSWILLAMAICGDMLLDVRGFLCSYGGYRGRRPLQRKQCLVEAGGFAMKAGFYGGHLLIGRSLRILGDNVSPVPENAAVVWLT